jgi:hypothetical protein
MNPQEPGTRQQAPAPSHNTTDNKQPATERLNRSDDLSAGGRRSMTSS